LKLKNKESPTLHYNIIIPLDVVQREYIFIALVCMILWTSSLAM